MLRNQNLAVWIRKTWFKHQRTVLLSMLLLAPVAGYLTHQALYPLIDQYIKFPVFLITFSTIPALIALLYLRREEHQEPGSASLYRTIRQQLSGAQDWDHFVDVLLQFPKAITPLAGSSLTICDPIKGSAEAIKEWSASGAALPKFSNLASLCSFNFIVQPQPLGFFIDPDSFEAQETEEPPLTCFCLPFLFASRHIGFLLLYLPPAARLDPAQITVLNELIPEIGFLLEFAYLRHSLVLQSEILDKEQRRIARYLHDTVAQNLAVLLHRLDGLLLDHDAGASLPELRCKLEQVQSLVGQADHQLRGSIADLRHESSIDLDSSLLDFAQEASHTAGFTLEISSTGEAQSLPAHLQLQVFSILREAIRNIEKHAGASRVSIHSLWESHRLTLTVKDDGRGFELAEAQDRKGHYGLKLMQESARELNGQLAIHSSPGAGTCITLTLPLIDPNRDFDSTDLQLFTTVWKLSQKGEFSG